MKFRSRFVLPATLASWLPLAVPSMTSAGAPGPVTINRHVTHWQSFDVPEAGPRGTSPVAMNDPGVIVGNYSDVNGMQHGFVRTPSLASRALLVDIKQLRRRLPIRTTQRHF
jgi:hypothetical protein